MKKLRVIGLLLLALSLSFVMIACGPSVTDVKLNKSELRLEVGSTETLKATVEPADSALVTWSVTDTNPAGCVTVDQEGKVSAVAAGTAQVTATAGDKSASCSITVLPSVESVTLNKQTLSLVIDAEETLTATVAPDNAFTKVVSWSVVDAEPAGCVTVTNGKVTAVEAGTAKVKATVGTQSDECTVTVTLPAVTSIAVSPGSLSLPVGGESMSLGVTVLPEKASQTITWSVTDASPVGCVTVDNSTGEITAVAQGTAIVKAVSTTDVTKFGTCQVTVTAAGTRMLIPVSTPADFLATRFLFDADYYLTNDIDFKDSGIKIHKPLQVVPESEWGTPGVSQRWYLPDEGIPYETATLNGTFDGRGYALKNFAISGIDSAGYYFGTNEWGRIADFEESIFGNIGATGVIKNIGFVGGTISTIGKNGIVAAENYGRIENIYVENVSITVTHNFGDSNCAGGLIVYRNMASGIIRNVVVKSATSAAGEGSNSSYPLALINSVSAANSAAQVANLFVANDSLGVKTRWVANTSPNGGTNLTPETNNAHLFAAADIASQDVSALPDAFWDKTETWPTLKALGSPILVLGAGSGTGYSINASIADEDMDYTFTLRVAASHKGTPAVTYSVLDGVSNQAATLVGTGVENADGTADYTFMIAAANVTGTITLGAVTGLEAKTTYAVTNSIVFPTGTSWVTAYAPAATAYEGVDYSFRLIITSATKDAAKIPKITYTVAGSDAVTIGHSSVSGSSSLTYTFVIPKDEITGAITLSSYEYATAQTFTVTNNIEFSSEEITWSTEPVATVKEGSGLTFIIHITAEHEPDSEPSVILTIGTNEPITITCTSVNIGGSNNRRLYTFTIPSTQISGDITLSDFQLVNSAA